MFTDLELVNIIPSSEPNEIHTYLYEQLSCRQYNISHQKTPTFAEHCAFVMRHPYRKWWLVKFRGSPVGSVYVKFDNSVGINLDTNYIELTIDVFTVVTQKIDPLKAVLSVRPAYFYINVPANDYILQDHLLESGFTEIQKTYYKG